MKQTLKKTIAIVLAVLMICGAAPIGALAELDWPTLPDGAVSSWMHEASDAVRSAAVRLGARFRGLSLRASAATYSGSCGADGDNVTWTLDTETGVLTITGTGAMRDYDYDSIPWYSYRYSIISVSIGNGVTSIGAHAFDDCSSLVNVSIPNSVTRIGNSAFLLCENLRNITIPKGVTSIGGGAFFECYALTAIIIPDSVTTIGAYAFLECNALTSITIPDSVTSIGEKAFLNCSSLESITLPFIGLSANAADEDSVFGAIFGYSASSQAGTIQQYYNNTDCAYYFVPASLRSVTVTKGTIPDYAFYNCAMLTGITIPDNVTTIGDSVFRGCTNLTSMIIPVGVTSIGDKAFYGCKSLANITIPKNVRSIGSGAFVECTELSVIVIPNSVQIIGTDAFYGCGRLSIVTIGNGVTSIGDYAFGSCGELTIITIGNSVTRIGDRAFTDCEKLSSITIPNSVEILGEGAFARCDSLVSVTIPSSVTSIGNGPFSSCAGLTMISVDANNPAYCSDENGVLYSKDKTILIQYPAGKAQPSFEVPNTVTQIGNDAFYDCKNLESVTIPDSVELIGDDAFHFCTVTSVTIGNNVKRIGTGAFDGCDRLENVTLPDGLEDIGYFAFNYCTSLRNLIIPDSVTSIGYQAFNGCLSLKEITLPFIPVGSSSALSGIFGDSVPSSLRSVTVTRGTIPDSAFANCSMLTDITFGDGVMWIDSGALRGCTGLKNITLPFVGLSAYYATGANSVFGAIFGYTESYEPGTTEQVDSNYERKYYIIPSSLRSVTVTKGTIPNHAFYHCTMLTNVTVGDGVTQIDDFAFVGCTGLTEITIPDSVTRIGEGAFSGCTALANITVPDSVTSLGAGVFGECTALQTAVIGNGATEIPTEAFAYCTSLERVTVGESVQSIGTQAFYNCSALRRIQFRGGKVSVALDAFDGCRDYAICCSESSYWHAYAVSNGLRYILTDETSASEFDIRNQVLLGYIGDAAKITVPSAVTMIGFEAFSENDTLTRIALPQSVTQIADYAFADCAHLAEVFIPDTVTSIGTHAFSGTHPTIICVENSYAHRFADAHNIPVRFVRILIDLENAIMRVEIPYENEPEVSLVHLTGVSLSVVGLRSAPAKTTYRVGEALNDDGLTLEAHYTNGMTSVLYDGFTVSAPVFDAPGEQTVTASYCGQTVAFPVTVTEEVVSGDADQSGTLDLRDIALLMRSLAGGWDVDLSDIDVDVNKDGTVDLKDVVLLRRYLAGGWNVQMQ